MAKRKRSVSRGRSRTKRVLKVAKAAARIYSRSKTKTNTSNTENKIHYSNGEMTNSKLTISRKMPKGVRPLGKVPDYFSIIGGSSANCGSGVQGVANLISWCPTTRLQEFYKEMLNTSANMATLNPLNSKSVDRRMFIDNLSYTCTITNQGPALIEVFLYDYICRKSEVTSADALFAVGVDQAEGTGDAKSTIVGTKPGLSQVLKNGWTLKKTTKIQMSSGGIHRHTVNHNIRKVYQMGYGWQEGAIKNVQGITMETLVVFHGTPCDSADSLLVNGQTTTAPAKLIWTNHASAKTRMLNFKSRKITQTDNLNKEATNLYTQNTSGVGIADVITNVVDVLTAFS
jgi:hypothetical protein